MLKNAPLRALWFSVIALVCFPLEAAQKNIGKTQGDEFVGIWQYQATYDDTPRSYLKITKVGAGKYRLIEGFTNPGDEKRITWHDQTQLNSPDPVIYLTLARGKLQGEVVSGGFRATHGEAFKYKLTLELQPNNKMRYSVWSSIYGKTETVEATRVGGAGATAIGAVQGGDGAAGGTSPMVSIPKQFQGHWDHPGEKHTLACAAGSESELYLAVTSTEIRYYEAVCQLKRIVTSNPGKFSGHFDCGGEGNKWKETIELKLDNGTLIHKWRGPRISRNTRCK